MGSWVLSIWLGSLCLNPAMALLPRLLVSPVDAQAIHVPNEPLATCHHHPEGCPRDCFCPKLTGPETDAEGPADPGTLAEPAMSHCSDADSPLLLSKIPLPDIQVPPLLALGTQASLEPHLPPRFPEDPGREPPRKIPRV